MTKQPPPDVALVPENKCLECGAVFDALGTGDRAIAAVPEPGSLIVCIKCAAVSILGDDLKPRGFTDQEMEELIANTEAMDELARMVRGIHFIRHQVG